MELRADIPGARLSARSYHSEGFREARLVGFRL